jgi:ABC-type sugar transport system permease subunit
LLTRASRSRLTDLLFVAPALILIAVFLAFPLVYGVAISVERTQGLQPVSFAGLDNYVRALFGDAVFHQSLANTIVFTAAAVVLQTALGLALALLVSRIKRGRGLVLIAFFAPFALASIAVGAAWKYLYAPFFGIAATVGTAAGLDTSTVAPLSDPHWALWAILIAFLWRFAGFSMVVYLAAIESIPTDMYDFTRLEGASRLQTLRHVTWPLLWPQTFALVLLTTIGSLRLFDMVWIMTGGGPSHATETVSTYVYTTAFQSLDVGYAQSMAMILFVVIVLLTVVEYRLLNRRAEAVGR